MLDQALQTYIAESKELLIEMETALLRLEQEGAVEQADRQELLNAVFRAAHTIKGSAGLFGLDDIVQFTHGVESLLDKLREGLLEIERDIATLLLSCCDHILDLVDHISRPEEVLDDDTRAKGQALEVRLQYFGAESDSNEKEDDASDKAGLMASAEAVEDISDHAVKSDNWHISLRFDSDSLRNGMDPISFLRYLTTLGKIVHINTLHDAVPGLDGMDPESCYLGFEINFQSSADKETIESVFEFIREDSLVRILPPHSWLNDFINHIHDLPEQDMLLGEILVRSGSLTQTELQEALDIQHSMNAQRQSRPLGSIVLEKGMTSASVLEAAVEKQGRVREVKARESQSVRVDADKLDHLINLIGELVIAGAGTALDAQANGDSVLMESVSMLTRLVEEVRDSALRLRMVQIGVTFNRFQRVVRDVAKNLNKQIELEINGAETELDKSVVEKIGDPLLHLVRNAIDHGIEAAEVRESQGKAVAGKVQLNAYHDSGCIVIEVSDDGGGLNKEAIFAKAVEKGLVQPDAQMDEQEIFELIFEPGFSTADSVTNLSGRGVGMDVVKRNITALRGTVEVDSCVGHGTTFRVRMPLTLAIIDGFLVGVDRSSFVVPLDMVVECVELNESMRGDSQARDYIDLRGEVLPLIRLRELFQMTDNVSRRESVVVVSYAGNRAGVVVDKLMGEFQTVIKPLGAMFSHIKSISGSTILGNGEVALIFDVPGLVQEASTVQSHAIESLAKAIH